MQHELSPGNYLQRSPELRRRVRLSRVRRIEETGALVRLRVERPVQVEARRRPADRVDEEIAVWAHGIAACLVLEAVLGPGAQLDALPARAVLHRCANLFVHEPVESQV